MNCKGFTLVEIGVTAIIIGILAAMVIPSVTAMTRRSYAQDAYQNLTTIYLAQRDYAGSHGDVYDTSSTVAGLNTNLGLNIITMNGSSYSCGANPCIATNASFTMKINLALNIKTSRPLYCTAAVPDAIYNPCCDRTIAAAAGKVAGSICP